MVFGLTHLGKVKELNGQYIQTRFVVIGAPLFPTGSQLIISDFSAIDIPLNSTSVLAGYGRFYSFLAAAICGILTAFLHEGGLYTLLGVIVFGIIWGRLMFAFGEPTENEILQRTKIGKVTGLYASPEWLYLEQVQDFFWKAAMRYREKYPDSDWKADLMSNPAPADRSDLFYSLALFNCMTEDSAENQALFDRADKLFVLAEPPNDNSL